MMLSKDLLRGTAELIVLETLANNGELYGYQLIKLIEEKSDNIFSFKQGTLYPLLYRLEEMKLVDSKEKNAPTGKTRRYYSITKQGRKSLMWKKSGFKEMVRGMSKILEITNS